MPKFTKSYDAQIVDVRSGSREIVAVISTAAVDRDGEVVLPLGLVRKNYAGLTVFYDHNTALPMGVVQWVKHSANRVLGKYRVSDRTQFARDMFNLAQDGVVTKHSIGFSAQDYGPPTAEEVRENPEWKTARRVYRRWELLEFSLVGVPANPEAELLAISKKVGDAGEGSPAFVVPTAETSVVSAPDGAPDAPTVIGAPRQLSRHEITVALARGAAWAMRR